MLKLNFHNRGQVASSAHRDSQHPTLSTPLPTTSKASAVHMHHVMLKTPHGSREVNVWGDRTILESADYAGISLPASCKVGSCTSCVGRVLEGHIEQKKQTCLDSNLISQGFVALCCAHPTSDNVVIQTHQGAAVRMMKCSQ